MASQVTAVRKTIKALRASGRLNNTHAALLAMVEAMAAELDNATSDEPNTASLWKEYRAAVGALVEVGADDDESDSADVVRLVRTPRPPTMGDAAN